MSAPIYTYRGVENVTHLYGFQPFPGGATVKEATFVVRFSNNFGQKPDAMIDFIMQHMLGLTRREVNFGSLCYGNNDEVLLFRRLSKILIDYPGAPTDVPKLTEAERNVAMMDHKGFHSCLQLSLLVMQHTKEPEGAWPMVSTSST
jgi:hypothetical protein